MDINEVIIMLKDDYALRNSLKRKNLSVHDELEDEIEDLEQSFISSHVIPKLEAYARELLEDLECETIITIKKDFNGNIEVCDELCYDGTPSKPTMPNDTAIIPPDNKPYNPNAELVVEFPDGTIFDDDKAIWTFVDAIKKIGLENVAKVGIEIKGYNLVDKRQRTDKGRNWQKHVGSYYVYSYLSNGDKMKYLNRISTYHKLGLKIVAQDTK